MSPAGFGEASHAVVVAHGSQHVARHIYFGNHIDAALTGISHHIFYLFLSVESAVHLFAIYFAIAVGRHHHVGIVPCFGASEANAVLLIVSAPSTFLGEKRVALDFDAPSLVVGEMPVEFIEFVGSNYIDNALHLVDSEEVTRNVDVHAAPLIGRGIGDGGVFDGVGLGVEHLQQGGNAVDYTVVAIAGY